MPLHKEGLRMQLGRIVDADGHVLEPPDLWEKNLPSKFKDRALGIARNEAGAECLVIDGKISDFTHRGSPFYFLSVTLGFDIQASFVSFFEGGTLERFPNLKLLCLEVGAGWVPHFIERMDSKWEHSGFMTACKRPPSEYFKRQVWIGADPDESIIATASRR